MVKTITLSDETYEKLDGERVINLIDNTKESDEEVIERILEGVDNQE
jgi:predicted CopG family antitoxin